MNTELEADGSVIGRRKARHLDICADPALEATITDPRGAGFGQVGFIHECLPEIDAGGIDLSRDFLGRRCRLPLLISCMTGGAGDGSPFNAALARVAERTGIAVGLGSMRVLFHDESALADFAIREAAPDVPLLANIGLAQVGEFGAGKIQAMAGRLGADAIVIHLNPGQELAQVGGDLDFRRGLAGIGEMVAAGGLPVIVKETGFGIRPGRVRELLALGVAGVDLAGAGGTDWLQVEAVRDPALADFAGAFTGWGLPTALLLAALREGGMPGNVIASGGMRNGVDVAKALALGAGMAGMALPFVRAWRESGEEGLERFVGSVAGELRAAMFLAGARNIEGLARVPLLFAPDFAGRARQLAEIEAGRK